MIYKFFFCWSFFSVLFGTFSTVFANSDAGYPVDLTSETFHSHLKHGLWLINFHRPTCQYCHQFSAFWKTAIKKAKERGYTSKYNFHFGSVDCSLHEAICTESNIRYVPQVLFYEEGEFVEEFKIYTISDAIVTRILDFIHEKTKDLIPADISKPSHHTDFVSTLTSKYHINPNGKSVIITTKNFNTLLSVGKNGWFIKFYVPSCYYCKIFARTWILFAKTMKGKLNVGEVNCQKDAELCTSLDIRSFPSLIYFKNTYSVQFRGIRSLQNLQKFSNKILLSTVRPVHDISTYRKFVNNYPIFFIYFHPHNIETEDIDIIDWMSVFLFGRTPFLKILYLHLGNRTLKIPTIAVFREGNVFHYPFQTQDDMRNKQLISVWIKKFWLPVFPQLNVDIIDHVMENHIVVIVIFYTSNQYDKKNQEIKNTLSEWKNYGTKNTNKTLDPFFDSIQFAWVNGTLWKNWLYNTYKMKKDGIPKVIIQNKRIMYWDKNINGTIIKPNKDSILNTLHVITRDMNKIKPTFFKSPSSDLTKTKSPIKKHSVILIVIYVIIGISQLVCLGFCIKRIRDKRHRKLKHDNQPLESKFE